MLDFEIVKQCLVIVLCCETGICQIPVDVSPFFKSSIIVHFQFVSNDERNDVVSQTFLEHQQTTNSAIAILERMNLFETDVKIQDIFISLQTE